LPDLFHQQYVRLHHQSEIQRLRMAVSCKIYSVFGSAIALSNTVFLLIHWIVGLSSTNRTIVLCMAIVMSMSSGGTIKLLICNLIMVIGWHGFLWTGIIPKEIVWNCDNMIPHIHGRPSFTLPKVPPGAQIRVEKDLIQEHWWMIPFTNDLCIPKVVLKGLVVGPWYIGHKYVKQPSLSSKADKISWVNPTQNHSLQVS